MPPSPHGTAGTDDLDAAEASEAEQLHRIEALPKEVGVLLIVAGMGGILLPGPVGSPFLILGGVVLWPDGFRRVEDWFVRRFPDLHRKSVRQIGRFLDDLDRRYPPAR
ncbi:hypothetical protein OJF2_08450 [Aquisphaera giovannonii]|uniref:Transmembrane protein (PGPGW) n=1 Tax=Aquisphaera giovannonii TaxID=406548 RepID=A0A5B9VX68_9BACT|nr:hypothetical protein [Aquisphaera giovannonii]QEH32375.1 hypothetical protein OJF2_08450 [Aquisphaera giovannonii]